MKRIVHFPKVTQKIVKSTKSFQLGFLPHLLRKEVDGRVKGRVLHPLPGQRSCPVADLNGLRLWV